MGEILDIVAHQWKNPLNTISINLMKIDFIDKNDFDSIYECKDKVELQIRHLVNTLDEFRGFFRDNTNSQSISIKKILESTLILVRDDLIYNEIEVILNIKDDSQLLITPNDFKHIILNFISNSKEAYIQNSIENRTINIVVSFEDSVIKIEFSDNAGGISKNIINNIFNLDFTTKKSGTGVGLYMTKHLVEKNNGTIEVKNIDNGVKFTLCFNKI
jgi:signal transduction histidine kinase